MRLLQGKRAEAAVRRLERRDADLCEPALEHAVTCIVGDVRRHGDAALRRYATRFDRLGANEPVRVSARELKESLARLSLSLRRAIESAARNIRRFCAWQRPRPFERCICRGVDVGQVVRALESVGCYVPGGRHGLPSSLLMTVLPAQAAGVPRIVVCSPRPNHVTLATAALLDVDEFYRVGGAQAIAALAYGTKAIPRVVKIVGPGNRYVTAAKKLVAFDCAIDMLAGPTEVLIVAERGKPEFIAADLAAQAEHDPDARAIFITTDSRLARSVAAATWKAARGNAVATAALRHSVALVAGSIAQALQWANRIAPEHITVPPALVPQISSAGSIFVGDYSPQAMGDYASGPNHVLPTGGAARARGGLSVSDFLKVITVQRASQEGLRAIAPVVTTLARAEGLLGHAASIQVRCGDA